MDWYQSFHKHKSSISLKLRLRSSFIISILRLLRLLTDLWLSNRVYSFHVCIWFVLIQHLLLFKQWLHGPDSTANISKLLSHFLIPYIYTICAYVHGLWFCNMVQSKSFLNAGSIDFFLLSFCFPSSSPPSLDKCLQYVMSWLVFTKYTNGKYLIHLQTWNKSPVP